MKEQDKITVRELNETEISNLSDRKFKVMVIKMVTGLEKRVDDLSETLNKEIENNNKKKQLEIKNSILKLKIH